MHRVDRSYLSTCINVAIRTIRAGKNGKAKHPVPELRDSYKIAELTALIVQQIDNGSSFVCRAGPSPFSPEFVSTYSPPQFGVDEPWPEGCEPVSARF